MTEEQSSRSPGPIIILVVVALLVVLGLGIELRAWVHRELADTILDPDVVLVLGFGVVIIAVILLKLKLGGSSRKKDGNPSKHPQQ
jgi:protein-S-isoprenylcysteine O-methyltransferase Ste14